MKVLPFKIQKSEQEALIFQEDIGQRFYEQLHQHEEIQISYIVKGAGTLIVGDSINNFNEKDIFVIGENLPHVLKTDKSVSESVEMLTLFFSKTSFGTAFFSLNDMRSAERFFEKSAYGMKVMSYNQKISEYFIGLKRQNKIERVASFLLILNLIIGSETEPLSYFVNRKKYTEDEGKRMSDVFEYAISSFNTSITLEEVAEIANMSKNSFCRYFKMRTNKTFFQFLIEIRIENACKMLVEDKYFSISQISELSGFQDITNFNRKFKELKGLSPSQYRGRF